MINAISIKTELDFKKLKDNYIKEPFKYGIYILTNRFSINSLYLTGWFKYDKYRPKPEQIKNICTPVPPIDKILFTIPGSLASWR